MTRRLAGWVKGLIVMEVVALAIAAAAVIALTKLGTLQREPEPLRCLTISLVVAVALLVASAVTSSLIRALSKTG